MGNTATFGFDTTTSFSSTRYVCHTNSKQTSFHSLVITNKTKSWSFVEEVPVRQTKLLSTSVYFVPFWRSHCVQRTHRVSEFRRQACTVHRTVGSIDQHTGWTSFLTMNVRVEVKSGVTSLGTSGHFWAPSFQVFTHFQPSQRKTDNTIVIRSQRTTR